MENIIPTPPKQRKHKMATISSEEFGALKEKVDHVDKLVEKLDEKLFGNGRPGIVNEITLLTQSVTNLCGKVDETVKRVDINSAKIAAIDPDPVLTWISKHWKLLLFSGICIFIILHSIIPADVNIWQLIQKLF